MIANFSKKIAVLSTLLLSCLSMLVAQTAPVATESTVKPLETTGSLLSASDNNTSNFQSFTAADARKFAEKLLEGNSTLATSPSFKISATCIEGKDNGNFKRTIDIDGNEILAFPLDELRRTSRYGLVENYKEGFARIMKDQVYGFLNICGEEIITPQYEKADNFNGGKALVKRGAEWFFTDAQGTESDALAGISDAKSLAMGISLVKLANGKQALINNKYDQTKKVISQEYEAMEVFKKGEAMRVRNLKKYGLVTLDGAVKLNVEYDNIEAFADVSGIYKIVQLTKIGMVDSTWKIQLQPIYTSISSFNTFKLAKATTEKGSLLIRQSDFKQTKMYASITDFNEFGIATVKDESGKFGLLDSEMKMMLEPKYGSIGNFQVNGLAPACYAGGNCGFIKYDGTEVIKAEFEQVSEFSKNGYAVARTILKDCNSKNPDECRADIVIDATGKVVVPVLEETTQRNLRLEVTDSIHSSLYIIIMAFQNGERNKFNFLLINKDSRELVTQMPYQAITSFDVNGIMRVKKDNMWGMIDTLGKAVAKCAFEEIRRPFEGYYAALQKDSEKWGYLNNKGKAIIPFEYSEVKYFRNGLAAVSKGNGKWGVISKFNAKIVPCTFKSIVINEGKYEVADEEGNVFTISDKGECEKNCAKFEEIRVSANKQALEGKPSGKN
jgi:hypothetical protein